jgi:hypothetical protein
MGKHHHYLTTPSGQLMENSRHRNVNFSPGRRCLRMSWRFCKGCEVSQSSEGSILRNHVYPSPGLSDFGTQGNIYNLMQEPIAEYNWPTCCTELPYSLSEEEATVGRTVLEQKAASNSKCHIFAPTCPIDMVESFGGPNSMMRNLNMLLDL